MMTTHYLDVTSIDVILLTLLQVTFLEIIKRESTMAMRVRTGNDDRGKLDTCLL